MLLTLKCKNENKFEKQKQFKTQLWLIDNCKNWKYLKCPSTGEWRTHTTGNTL